MTIYDDYVAYTKQYRDEYGDKTVVFIEVGSFWELYNCDKNLGADIKNIADILGIQVSKKNKSIPEVSAQNPLMAGFPNYALSKFIPCLLDYNYTIVLVGQITQPPNPKRGVTKIISKSTYFDSDSPSVSTYNSNYLCSMYFDEVIDYVTKKPMLICGACIMDLATGKSHVYELPSKPTDPYFSVDEAYHILRSFNPCEVVLNGSLKTLLNKDDLAMRLGLLKDSKTIHLHNLINMKMYRFTSVESISILSKVFTTTGLLSPVEYIHLEKHPYALNAFITSVEFAYRHDELIIQKISKPELSWSTKETLLSHNCIEQLEIKGLDNIVNRCSTAPGRRLFRYRLFHPIYDVNELENRYKMIDRLCELGLAKVSSASSDLKSVYDIERLFHKLELSSVTPADLANLTHSLIEVRKVAKALLSTKQDIFTCSKSRLTINMLDKIIDYILTSIDIGLCSNIISDSVFVKGKYSDVDYLSDKIGLVQKEVQELVESLNILSGNTGFFKIDSNERDGLHLTITTKRFADLCKADNYANWCFNASSFQIRSIKELKTQGLASNGSITKLSSPGLKNVDSTRVAWEASLKTLVTKYFKEFCQSICNTFDKDVFTQVVEFTSVLDISLTCAKNALEYGYCRPMVQDTYNNLSLSTLCAKQMRHPIVERLNDQRCRYVPNDINLGGPNQQGMLLYGLNAAGKSTLMKAVALNVVMAQAGMFVACQDMLLIPYRQVFTRITKGDDIFTGQSTFMVEMSELRNILARCNKYSLVIGDEICSGTEATSAIAIVASSIYTLDSLGANYIFATHLHDLTNISKIKELHANGHVNVCHLHVECDPCTGKLIYDRTLRDGQGSHTYGVEVCKSLDMPPGFLDMANAIRREYTKVPGSIVNQKKSKYNSMVSVTSCTICGSRENCEVHHIKFQKDANENNLIDHMHKNHVSNLVVLCQSCHDKVHNNEIKVNTYRQTSYGIELDVERGAQSIDKTEKEDPDLLSKMLELRRDGASFKKIANVTGVSIYRVKKTLGSCIT